MAAHYGHRRPFRLVLLVTFLLCLAYFTFSDAYQPTIYLSRTQPFAYVHSSYDWARRKQTHPVEKYEKLPTGRPLQLAKIQYDFPPDMGPQEYRRREVKRTFKKCWDSYRRYAWGRDELNPISLAGADTFAGWGATLVDSLDSLWMLDMKPEFMEALHQVATIDWDKTGDNELCSLFETNIRYLGGLLSAYDLSNEMVLLRKAIELGDMLYNAFDTPNRLPTNSFHFERAKKGELNPSTREILANVGSLSLEFTRLSQLTGDPKYFDAIERVKQKLAYTQERTKLPGMWPTFVDVANGFQATDSSFTMGSMADSTYEYLPKMYMLLGGLDDSYKKMHTRAMSTAKRYMLFRPMLPDYSVDILFSGNVLSNGNGVVDLVPQGQHLTCFVGGMFALGGRLFDSREDVDVGARLSRGCAWAYKVMPTHVMPEQFTLVPCHAADLGRCAWDEDRWDQEGDPNLPRGFSTINVRSYLLRPEAVESVFYMWRITGDEVWRDTAWEMFQAILKITDVGYAHSAVKDVTKGEPEHMDQMEVSFISLDSAESRPCSRSIENILKELKLTISKMNRASGWLRRSSISTSSSRSRTSSHWTTMSTTPRRIRSASRSRRCEREDLHRSSVSKTRYPFLACNFLHG